MLTSKELNSHNRYFSTNRAANKARSNAAINSTTTNNNNESVNPILRNVFMRPQVISLNQQQPQQSNNHVQNKSQQQQDTGMSISSSSSSSSSASSPTQSNSSSSSLSTTPQNETPSPPTTLQQQQPRSILRRGTSARMAAAHKAANAPKNIANQIENLLDSKKAREAFFERIRSETLKVTRYS